MPRRRSQQGASGPDYVREESFSPDAYLRNLAQRQAMRLRLRRKQFHSQQQAKREHSLSLAERILISKLDPAHFSVQATREPALQKAISSTPRPSLSQLIAEYRRIKSVERKLGQSMLDAVHETQDHMKRVKEFVHQPIPQGSHMDVSILEGKQPAKNSDSQFVTPHPDCELRYKSRGDAGPFCDLHEKTESEMLDQKNAGSDLHSSTSNDGKCSSQKTSGSDSLILTGRDEEDSNESSTGFGTDSATQSGKEHGNAKRAQVESAHSVRVNSPRKLQNEDAAVDGQNESVSPNYQTTHSSAASTPVCSPAHDMKDESLERTSQQSPLIPEIMMTAAREYRQSEERMSTRQGDASVNNAETNKCLVNVSVTINSVSPPKSTHPKEEMNGDGTRSSVMRKGTDHTDQQATDNTTTKSGAERVKSDDTDQHGNNLPTVEEKSFYCAQSKVPPVTVSGPLCDQDKHVEKTTEELTEAISTLVTDNRIAENSDKNTAVRENDDGSENQSGVCNEQRTGQYTTEAETCITRERSGIRDSEEGVPSKTDHIFTATENGVIFRSGMLPGRKKDKEYGVPVQEKNEESSSENGAIRQLSPHETLDNATHCSHANSVYQERHSHANSVYEERDSRANSVCQVTEKDYATSEEKAQAVGEIYPTVSKRIGESFVSSSERPSDTKEHLKQKTAESEKSTGGEESPENIVETSVQSDHSTVKLGSSRLRWTKLPNSIGFASTKLDLSCNEECHFVSPLARQEYNFSPTPNKSKAATDLKTSDGAMKAESGFPPLSKTSPSERQTERSNNPSENVVLPEVAATRKTVTDTQNRNVNDCVLESKIQPSRETDVSGPKKRELERTQTTSVGSSALTSVKDCVPTKPIAKSAQTTEKSARQEHKTALSAARSVPSSTKFTTVANTSERQDNKTPSTASNGETSTPRSNENNSERQNGKTSSVVESLTSSVRSLNFACKSERDNKTSCASCSEAPSQRSDKKGDEHKCHRRWLLSDADHSSDDDDSVPGDDRIYDFIGISRERSDTMPEVTMSAKHLVSQRPRQKYQKHQLHRGLYEPNSVSHYENTMGRETTFSDTHKMVCGGKNEASLKLPPISITNRTAFRSPQRHGDRLQVVSGGFSHLPQERKSFTAINTRPRIPNQADEREHRIMGLYNKLKTFSVFCPSESSLRLALSKRTLGLDMQIEWGSLVQEDGVTSADRYLCTSPDRRSSSMDRLHRQNSGTDHQSFCSDCACSLTPTEPELGLKLPPIDTRCIAKNSVTYRPKYQRDSFMYLEDTSLPPMSGCFMDSSDRGMLWFLSPGAPTQRCNGGFSAVSAKATKRKDKAWDTLRKKCLPKVQMMKALEKGSFIGVNRLRGLGVSPRL